MNQLHDHYGQELNIGDMVLGAVAGGRWRQTRYIHSVVVGRTLAMVRLHQISETGLKPEVLESLKNRGTKRGGKVIPQEVIRLTKGFLSFDEVEKYSQVKIDPNGVVLPKALQMLPKSPVVQLGLTALFNP
tara:strand:- start:221 stop:613 length:393 start_codon:yes stop_codon:yes gene_type:complete